MRTGDCGLKKNEKKQDLSNDQHIPPKLLRSLAQSFIWYNKLLDGKKRLWVMFLKVRKARLKFCLSEHICTSLGNGPVPRNLVDSLMFLVAYQCRMCEKSQNGNAASTTLKLNRGKSRVELTRIGRKVTGKKSKEETKKRVERSRDDSG